MIKVGLVGGTGYTAGELIRILLNHPDIIIKNVVSVTKAYTPLFKIHKDLLGDTDLHFTNSLEKELDVIFLCISNGYSIDFIKNISEETCIIDLSRNFRLIKNEYVYNRHFVYGLPELQRNKIKNSRNIANPGCFATAIQLALLPLAKNRLLEHDIHISAITGSSGAGKPLTPKNHFSWRANNMAIYKVFTHQHLEEVYQTINIFQNDFNKEIYFVPYRGNFTRGIIATIYMRCVISLNEGIKLYKKFYKSHPFTHVSEERLNLKQVVNTNKCLIHLDKKKDFLIISCVIDNLLKGASGQAIQNMNLLFGLRESCSLNLKAIAL